MTPIEAPEAGLNAAVAAELRAERAAQNLTVQQLADRADVPYASLRRYLAAERYIDVAVLHALAVALHTTPAALVAAAEERLSRRGGGVVIPADFGDSSDAAPSLKEKLEGLPSAAAPKRRDTGQGDDDA
jgi:transcriptional regulator with XRE-family HTH domain